MAERQPLSLHRLPEHRQSSDRRHGREVIMISEGIGASVLRKEDFRFLTGRGRYTDDINRPDQTFAVIVRSPRAHARIRSIDTAKAKAAPGVVAVFTGADYAPDKIGGIPCGWFIKSKDGSPM